MASEAVGNEHGNGAERAGAAERWERYRSNIAAAAAALQLEHSDTARRALEAAPPGAPRLGVATPAQPARWLPRRDARRKAGLGILCGHGRSSARRATSSPPWTATGAINIWDVTTGTAIAALRGHEGPVLSLAYSPDGKRLASGSADKTIRLWELAIGKRQWRVLRGHEKPVEWLSYSPDGQRICSLDGESGRLWDATHGPGRRRPRRPCAEFHRALPAGWSAARHRPGSPGLPVRRDHGPAARRAGEPRPSDPSAWRSARTASGSRPTASTRTHIRLWDGVTGREVAVLRGHTVGPGVLAFSPDGSRLASGSPYPDNSVRLWDAATGRPIAALHGHTNTVRSVAFSPDGQRLVSGSLDQTARLWDGVNGQPVATLRGHTDRLWDAIFSPDGRRVVTASADRTLRLWDATSGDLIAVLLGHRAEVLGAAFAAHGSLLVSRSADGESRVWDMELAERNGILRGHGSFVYDVAFSPDGTRVASAAWDGTVRLWDATTGRQTARAAARPPELGREDRQLRRLAP